ncbi:hypothetical protein ACHQM5_023807 [Ranunculus cassubicifolius]
MRSTLMPPALYLLMRRFGRRRLVRRRSGSKGPSSFSQCTSVSSAAGHSTATSAAPSTDQQAQDIIQAICHNPSLMEQLRSTFVSKLKSVLSKLGVPEEILGASQEYLKIPQAKGALSALRGQPFFIPLYSLYLTYGGVFRLTFGPKSFLIVSDPSVAKHILKDNSKAYSKGILGEILDFVMGKGLIPANGEIWRVRRRAIVPALHQKYVAAMISLFGDATDRLVKKLDTAASDGEDVEMESLFSRLTLDIIGKALFNYDFDSLTNDTGIVEDRSVSPIPVWDIPVWKDLSPRQRKVTSSLKLINDMLNDLIAICKRMVDEEELQFYEEYMNEQDPSILHFLLASGDDVSSKQLRDDLMTMLIAGHETSAAVLTWTFYLLSQGPNLVSKFLVTRLSRDQIRDRIRSLKIISGRPCSVKNRQHCHLQGGQWICGGPEKIYQKIQSEIGDFAGHIGQPGYKNPS